MSPLLCICAPKTCYARIGSKPNKHKHNHTQQWDIRDSPNLDTSRGAADMYWLWRITITLHSQYNLTTSLVYLYVFSDTKTRIQSFHFIGQAWSPISSSRQGPRKGNEVWIAGTVYGGLGMWADNERREATKTSKSTNQYSIYAIHNLGIHSYMVKEFYLSTKKEKNC